ncbi:FAD-dependent oxidoreductase [Paracoccus laeviglucosivorans]|uniref:Succinate dehydrogenase/fumarate reductase, flavoprotein subunit n=1 Tax=Paracoccus laeviglucosivorans TaxID=1197861 RepID=A0A521FTP6_9RHOB|nr:FAD-dependent oxidoreductase [Paracoccus laeviglucosivorans]SMO98920.1 Succinate dehydrogenase/fumarate reductase, flavoprotein subunit [Paracoccus laeviglucosivorans]
MTDTAVAGDSMDCDLLVAGSGAAGLAAALTAQRAGLDVLLVEKAAVFGGTSALSGGGVWVPGNRFSRKAQQGDSPERALQYLQSVCGNNLNVPLAKTYLSHCVEAVEYLERVSDLRFGPNPIPDYRAELPGGIAGERSLRAARFDGRKAGDLLPRLRKPLESTTIFGGMMVSAEDLPDLFSAGRSPRAALRSLRLLSRHFLDKLFNQTVTRLANGNALVAELATAFVQAGGRIWLETPLQHLLQDQSLITGAVVCRNGRNVVINAGHGVVLAGGGAPHGTLRDSYDHVAAGIAHHSLAPVENTGDLIAAGQACGAVCNSGLSEPAALTPVSQVPLGRDTCGFPHFFDRSKPGFIAIDQTGRRFGNEADEYHVFARKMICGTRKGGRMFLICDHRALRRYGAGAVPPFPGRLSRWVRNGYLLRGRDLAELAVKMGCPVPTVAETVRDFNACAAEGADPAFGRGTSIYNRFIGDALATASNLAPLEHAPFYAIELFVGDLGTFAGLATNENAQVLGADGACIQGLYAIGNDATSFMGGAYPAAGITLGPALTFGYVAARHASGRRAGRRPQTDGANR